MKKLDEEERKLDRVGFLIQKPIDSCLLCDQLTEVLGGDIRVVATMLNAARHDVLEVHLGYLLALFHRDIDRPDVRGCRYLGYHDSQLFLSQ